MNKNTKPPAGKLTLSIMAAVFTIWLAVPFQAEASSGVAARLLGKTGDLVGENLGTVRNRPTPQSDLAKTFDERDHYRNGAAAPMGPEGKTSMFFDMRHDVDQENETWHGSAGLQIVW